MTNFLLNIKNICLTHSNNLIQKTDDFTLQNISFQLPNHSSISILGESATGKSSLIMALMKLHPIDSGEILYKNRSIYHFSKKETIAYQQNIQPVFQNYDDSLNPKLKILKSLTLGMDSNFSQQKRNKKIQQLLELTELDETILHKRPHQLSGGEKQRVTIARALVTNPEIIILDEPFSSLDVLNQENLLKVLKKIQSELNLSYIFITHKIPLVKHFQDKIYLIQNNEMLQFDTYENLIKTMSYDD